MPNLGLILSCYDRIDDLLAHIDIMKYFPDELTIIPVYLKKEVPNYFLDDLEIYNPVYCDGKSFYTGTLLSFCAGLRRAAELGLDYVIYRNGDDWLFNHDFVRSNVAAVVAGGHLCAAYNWFTVGSRSEYAMNEMIVSVPSFSEHIPAMEEYFLNKSSGLLCELKIARWVNYVAGDRFYRLPDREQQPGIGCEPLHIERVFAGRRLAMPSNYKEMEKVNNRFFNKKWQLIGSHDNRQRFQHYASIRSDIKYHSSLETEKNFGRWLSSCRNGGKWNLPSERLASTVKKPPVVRKSMPQCLIT